jgi:hypothetical protein
MSQPEPVQPPENTERLSWDEIKRRHPNEWVVLVDDDFVENHMVLSRGVVFAHSPDRRVIMDRSRHLPSAAIRYTGKRGSFTMWALGHVARKL